MFLLTKLFLKINVLKGHEGAILSRSFGLVSGSFPCEVFKMNTYLSLVLVLAHFLFSSI